MTVVAQFKVVRNDRFRIPVQKCPSATSYFLAWTTTPWTLPSNTAPGRGKRHRLRAG
ncbi:MAG: hypothetical protein MZV63_55640 [Marinilabiliales bacterium]|nr:hypothetical protein [Marinilabiliales bacterium]